MKIARLLRQTPKPLVCCLLYFLTCSCNRESSTTVDTVEGDALLSVFHDLAEVDVPVVERIDPAEVEAASKVFRRIEVENRARSEYSRFPTGVIRSQKALDAFIEMEDPSPILGDHGIEAFYSTLRRETIEFPREVLFLFRHFRPSSSYLLDIDSTTLSTGSGIKPSRHLIFRLVTEFVGAGLAAELDNCFPVVVDSSSVDLVSLEVNGVEVYSADLTKSTPPIVVAPKRHSKRKPAVR